VADAVDVEASFRNSVSDAIPLIKALSRHCRTVDDVVKMLELALVSDGQLHMIIEAVAPLQLRR
jgi:hypothetical protein